MGALARDIEGSAKPEAWVVRRWANKGYGVLAHLVGHRVFKFGLVGLSGIGVNVGSLWFLTDVIGLFYVASAIVAHVLSVTNNFTWNELWTFKDRGAESGLSAVVRRWVKFLLTTLIVLAVYMSVLTLMTEVLKVYYIVSSLCAICVAFPVNFLTSYLLVWKRSRR